MSRRITPHFLWVELICVHCQRIRVDDRLFQHMDLLEQLRVWWAAPLRVTSGYRCPKHNKAVGGAKRSQHLHFATDIQAISFGSRQRQVDAVDQLADKAEQLGFDGIGRYSTFVHLDIRGEKAAWNDR